MTSEGGCARCAARLGVAPAGGVSVPSGHWQPSEPAAGCHLAASQLSMGALPDTPFAAACRPGI